MKKPCQRPPESGAKKPGVVPTPTLIAPRWVMRSSVGPAWAPVETSAAATAAVAVTALAQPKPALRMEVMLVS